MKKIDYKTYTKPSDFLTLRQGDNPIQIISAGAIGKVHGSRMQGRYIPLGVCTENEACPFCMQGNEPKRVWRWIVIDKLSGETKLLNAGSTIGNEICLLAQTVGDPLQYEITISRAGLDKKTKYVVKNSGPAMAQTEIKKHEAMRVFLVKKYLMEGGNDSTRTVQPAD